MKIFRIYVWGQLRVCITLQCFQISRLSYFIISRNVSNGLALKLWLRHPQLFNNFRRRFCRQPLIGCALTIKLSIRIAHIIAHIKKKIVYNEFLEKNSSNRKGKVVGQKCRFLPINRSKSWSLAFTEYSSRKCELCSTKFSFILNSWSA